MKTRVFVFLLLTALVTAALCALCLVLLAADLFLPDLSAQSGRCLQYRPCHL